jgi:hypothetical protein
MALITKRHDAIVQRVTRAARLPPGPELRLNRAVPHTNSQLRPDIVVFNERSKDVLLLDVACPFENGPLALRTSRSEKMRKYAPLVDELTRAGYVAQCGAIIVGALGSWDGENERWLRRLNIAPSYIRVMARLASAETIGWSRDIYFKHVFGARAA